MNTVPGSVIVTLKKDSIEEQFEKQVESIDSVVNYSWIMPGNIVKIDCEEGKGDEVLAEIAKLGHTGEREYIAYAS